ncbi:MAG TPA: ATP-binding protein, partial [Syntrophales bacterium]
ALRTKNVIFSDLRWGEIEKAIHLDIFIPLIGPKSNNAVGVLLLRIDPFEYIFPLIQSWPTQSVTAETLLARREGDDVVYLNELRHKKGTALNLRLPISSERLPAAIVVQGKEGIVEGIDYRGSSVLAAVRAIPNSPWYLIAKMDTTEAYAPILEHFWIVAVTICVMIFMSGLILLYIWQNQSERYLLASRRKMQNILDSITDCYYSLDREWRFTEINNQALQYFEMEREDVLGKSYGKVFPAGLGSLFEEQYKKAVTEQVPVHFDARSPGVDKWAEIHAYPSEEGLSVYFKDIDAHKKAEEAVRESREDLNHAQAVAHIGNWRLDVRRNELMWSDETYRMFGIPKGTPLTYETFRSIIHPEDREYVDRKWTAAMRGEPYDIQHRIVVGERVKWVVERAELEFDPQGLLLGGFGTVQDITERKATEMMIKERTTQLEVANNELEEFSYSVSHDLRAPLRAIDGFSLMLLRNYGEKLDEEGVRKLNIISRNAKQMGQLIDDLLSFSRLTRKEMHMSKVHMETMAGDVWREIKESNPDREFDFKIINMIPGFGDSSLIKQVLVNLLSNAVKFTKDRKPAVIETGSYREGSEVIYYVKDNGVGFDMKYHDKLFGVFERLHNPQEYEGTGVGLAIVQRIIHRHGGRIWAEGKANGGATFYFTLPEKEMNYA